MTTKRSQLEKDLQDANDTLDSISDLVDEALDPELSREEVVAKLKEIQEAVAEEEEEPGE
jgi:hypothetical protein